MRLSPYIALLALLVAGVAQASPPMHPGQTVGHRAVVSTVLGSQPQTLYTKKNVPNVASAKVDVFVNGKVLLYGGADSSRIVEIAGHGVIAVVSVTRKAGPGIARLASTRHVPVRVRVVFTWR